MAGITRDIPLRPARPPLSLRHVADRSIDDLTGLRIRNGQRRAAVVVLTAIGAVTAVQAFGARERPLFALMTMFVLPAVVVALLQAHGVRRYRSRARELGLSEAEGKELRRRLRQLVLRVKPYSVGECRQVIRWFDGEDELTPSASDRSGQGQGL